MPFYTPQHVDQGIVPRRSYRPSWQLRRWSSHVGELPEPRGTQVKHAVINVSYLAGQIIDAVLKNKPQGLHIDFSREPPGALETGGGIFNALQKIPTDSFIVVNADIWTDFDFRLLPAHIKGLAHLILVPNPPHNADGDFLLDGSQVRIVDGDESLRLTYSGISVLKKELFKDCVPGRFPLAPLLQAAVKQNSVSGAFYDGRWSDIGSAERLEAARSLSALDH